LNFIKGRVNRGTTFVAHSRILLRANHSISCNGATGWTY